MDQFNQIIGNSYTFKGASILLGSAVLNDNYNTGILVKMPLATLNRHGLIAGATGTGKTKSLQVISENLSRAGVPVVLMDIKGDVSGLAKAGKSNPVIEQRAGYCGIQWEPTAFPVELLSISNEPGARMRATISEFGPVLLSRILELNDNQAGLLSLIFKYCDDKSLPLLDLKDLQTTIQYLIKVEAKDFITEYGYFQTSTAGIILRKIVELEQQNADLFFGEPSFEVEDLTRRDKDGKGLVNIIRLTDMLSKPALFSTFMLCLLAEIFQKFPEKGDAEKPELVIFIDEAHLIFKEASKSLLEQLEMTIKLVRSKGVGIVFITQNPDDIPASILGQLGFKVQHALRAFTANDRKAIKNAAENYPSSQFYKLDELITRMGTGEALITVLNEKGLPTEVVHTCMAPPASRMDVLQASEIEEVLRSSELVKEYNKETDRESAYEILQKKLKATDENNRDVRQNIPTQEVPTSSGRRSTRKEGSVVEDILKSPVTKMVARELTRGLFGVLGLKTRRR
ncbi:MAG: helicase HerA-like domain-containing protein [Bacteroidales bacterium]